MYVRSITRGGAHRSQWYQLGRPSQGATATTGSRRTFARATQGAAASAQVQDLEKPQWGRVTVPEGDRVAFWHHSGKCSILVGPAQTWAFGHKVEPMRPHTAGPTQYIAVSWRTGEIEILRGPISVWEDPVRHASVSVHSALEVASNEAIVVYKDTTVSGSKLGVQRSVVRGPTLYVPSGHAEWLHRFSWHGTDERSLKEAVQRKLPGLLRFEKLRLAPDQVYFDIPDVRTKDDALIVVKVMVFLTIKDVEKMLDNTQDPVSEFLNALNADIVEFVGGRTFEEFKSQLEQLNSLASYIYLSGRAAKVGYEVTKVVLRGYSTSQKLQLMHDDAIHKRTELALQRETQTQEQDLKDYKLDRDSARFERQADYKLKRARERQTMEHDKAVHQQLIQDVEAKATLERERRRHELEMARAEELQQQRLSHQKQEKAAEADHYGRLRALGVDLSSYLMALARGTPQRWIEIGSGRGLQEASGTQLHIHSHDSDDAPESGKLPE
mmetsp:Transcript_36766/g.84652  ORF Transcript_36766/g.84652 Transcript_36766/m.84652 type:complete len:497 (-) Transcript_36766:33-1523(-)